MSYIERKDWEAQLQAMHIVKMLNMAMGGKKGVSKGHTNATAEQAIGEYLRD